jgi:hypothetical protein
MPRRLTCSSVGEVAHQVSLSRFPKGLAGSLSGLLVCSLPSSASLPSPVTLAINRLTLAVILSVVFVMYGNLGHFTCSLISDILPCEEITSAPEHRCTRRRPRLCCCGFPPVQHRLRLVPIEERAVAGDVIGPREKETRKGSFPASDPVSSI